MNENLYKDFLSFIETTIKLKVWLADYERDFYDFAMSWGPARNFALIKELKARWEKECPEQVKQIKANYRCGPET